eukprot:CAMPEP_0181313764 /NCGR_PEP_ID=MMETSP1101-20121128/14430_1 /TAXON_ID=46948 /ORGANISM="Rhodomonas abbreviata, Strain Caron Lab Isolate" /LENGTH=464 /DNA_ID=CAMNT_0023420755 /DNA_START=94 /DNA_END=1484 /DNA_ORIENTATION=+
MVHFRGINLSLCCLCIFFLLTNATNTTSDRESLTEVTFVTGFPTQKTLIWGMHVVPPFAFYDSTKTGNAQFTGLVPELAALLEPVLNVKFTFVLGAPSTPENEEAVLSTLDIEKDANDLPPGVTKAHLAGGGIHVSANRSLAVRFSTPFFETGYRLVVAVPPISHDPLSFGAPFHDLLWLVVAIEILLISVAIYFMEAPAASFSQESDLADGQIAGMWDSLYMACTFMLGTADKAPKTWGGKMALLAHGWFMLIIIASYTANLASFLVMGALTPSVSGWADVTSSGGKLSLALPRGGTQESFLAWEEHHYGYKFNVTWTTTMAEAYDLVATGAADATFDDEAIAQYYLLKQVADPCALMAVGRTFHTVFYGLAFALDDMDFIPFSEAIVLLRETGAVSKLATKYQVGAGGEKAEADQVAQCAGGSNSGVLVVEDFWGLIGIIAGVLAFSFAIHVAERYGGGAKV